MKKDYELFENKYVVIDEETCKIDYNKSKISIRLEELNKIYIKLARYKVLFGNVILNKKYMLCIDSDNKHITLKLEENDRMYFIEAISAFRRLQC